MDEGIISGEVPSSIDRPASVENKPASLSTVEAENHLGNILGGANELLKTTKEGKWNDGPWYQRTDTAKNLFGDRDTSKTFSATTDKDTNTSFMSQKGHMANGAEYTMIRWADLPDQPGGQVKGGGYIRHMYDREGNPINTETGKWQAGPNVGPYDERTWSTHNTSALTNGDFKGTPFERKNQLTAEELADIKTRFQRSIDTRSSAENKKLNEALTKKAVGYAELLDRVGKNVYDKGIRSGEPIIIQLPGQQTLREVLDEFYKETDKNPEEERKMREEQQRRAYAQTQAADIASARARGVLTEEMITDPNFSRIWESKAEEVLLKQGNSVDKEEVVSPDDRDRKIDREVIKVFNSLATIRRELQTQSTYRDKAA